jgi:Carboxypeptidase regulatory-like domain
MRGLVIGLSTMLVICAFASGLAWGQATAQISGTVKDASGAVLPGVEITATQTETGTARTTISNETGFYVLPSLPLGPYKLEAALAGFRTFAQTGIVLQVNSNPVIDVSLQVGQVTETVEVAAQVSARYSRLSVFSICRSTAVM